MASNKKLAKSDKRTEKKAALRKPVLQKPVAKKVIKPTPKKKPTAPVKKLASVLKKPVSVPKKISAPAKKSVVKKVTKPTPKKKSVAPVKKLASAPKKPTSASKKISAPAQKPVAKKMPTPAPVATPKKQEKLPESFIKKQKVRLLELKDFLLDNVRRVVVEGDDQANAFGMHQADAGSDSYDRDFALSSLSHSHNSLREIDQALGRIDSGTYGYCESCSKLIPQARLEALPHARFTVDCQSEMEKDKARHTPVRQATVSTIWGSEEDETEDNDEDFIEEK